MPPLSDQIQQRPGIPTGTPSCPKTQTHSRSACRVGWSLQISRTPLGFELSGSVRIFGHDELLLTTWNGYIVRNTKDARPMALPANARVVSKNTNELKTGVSRAFWMRDV